MSTTDLGTSIHPANVIQPAVPAVHPPSGRKHAWVHDDAATEDPLVRDPRLLRVATSPEVASSRNFHPRLFDDPCNYLG
ncbi:MAG TPA: hypothetical protein VES02_12260 [Dermatophilaceae bacterium]|nr:hypothetical protein [Dermatophilaceae bacterium]